jgi:hypothetical protein
MPLPLPISGRRFASVTLSLHRKGLEAFGSLQTLEHTAGNQLGAAPLVGSYADAICPICTAVDIPNRFILASLALKIGACDAFAALSGANEYQPEGRAPVLFRACHELPVSFVGEERPVANKNANNNDQK